MFKKQDLQMFGPKLNKYEEYLIFVLSTYRLG